MWQSVTSIINKHRTFVISTHIQPDGDALGSALALAEHLQNLGKEVTILNSDPADKNMGFLDPNGLLTHYSTDQHRQLIKQAQVIIVVDASGGWSRLGDVGKALEKATAQTVCIDHHPDPTDFVDVAVVDVDAAATTELIYSLIQAMNGTITPTIATALYTGILTDSGSFRFPKTSPNTHHVTARLLAAGANPLHIYSQIFERDSLKAVQLRGYLMNAIQLTAGGQIAYYSLPQRIQQQYQLASEDMKGLSSLAQSIESVRISIYCKETSDGHVKISLRSDGSVAINQLATAHGGGGHPSAAGARVKGNLETVLAEVVGLAQQLIANQA